MRVPSNMIEIKYTSGNEFVFVFNYKYYQGYYYELNDKFFIGREFNVNAPEIIKANSKEINTALTNPKTYKYGSLSKIKPNNSKLISIPLEFTPSLKYLAKQIASNPIRIIFTTKEAFLNAANYPGFIFTSISFEPEFGFLITEENRKAIPEIDIFLAEYSQI